MNAGLIYLLTHRPIGGVRRLGRRFAGYKGKVLLGAMLLFGFIVVGSQLLVVSLRPEAEVARGPLSSADLRVYVPPALLVMALIGTRVGAFFFKPAEVHFLLPAPIGRRQLLIYNVLAKMQISLLSAMWVFILVVRFAPTWYGAFLAAFLLLTFNQVTGQLAGLWLAATKSRTVWTRARSGGLLIAGALLVVAAVWPLLLADPEDFGAAVQVLLRSPLIATLSWLTRPFLEVFLAESAAAVAAWSLVGVAILAAQVLLMIRLDLSYMEGLLAAGARARAGRRRRSTTDGSASRARERLHLRLPIDLFPSVGGAGPLAWRQIQELLRDPGTAMRGGLGLVALLPMIIFRTTLGESEGASVGVAVFITAVLVIPMMTDGVDFRRDLDRMAVLRALPLSALAVTLGQLVPTTFLLSFWLMIALLFIGGIMMPLPDAMLLIAIFTIPPFALMTAAIDNWLFLLAPYRPRTRDPGETTFVGRLTMVMSIKMIALFIAMGLTLGAVTVALTFVTPSPLLAAIVAAAALSACCVPLIVAVASAFRSFDVSQEVPE